MNNLFILHTQYNIIIGSSIVLTKLKGDCNDLIVYAEFTVSDSYKESLSKIFNNIVFIRDKFKPLPKNFIEEDLLLRKEYHIFKASGFANKKYDHVFLSQERPLDCLIVGYLKRKNSSCICSDIEEDCYYSLNNKYNDINYVKPQGKNIIHRLKRFLYGRKYLYSTDGLFFGHSEIYDDYYVLYPSSIRELLKRRKVVTHQVEKNDIIKALNAIYGEKKTEMPSSNKYYLFFFDLLERYKNPKSILHIVQEISKRASKEKAVLLLKYHPRETNKFTLESTSYEIPAIVPAEKLLCDLLGNDVVVYGNATTSIIVANKFGFKTYSVAKLNGSENNTMFNTFKQMGILVPSKIDEI